MEVEMEEEVEEEVEVDDEVDDDVEEDVDDELDVDVVSSPSCAIVHCPAVIGWLATHASSFCIIFCLARVWWMGCECVFI